MSGQQDLTGDADPGRAARDQWITRVLAFEPVSPGRKLPRRAAEAARRRNEEIAGANQKIKDTLEATSSRHPPLPVWGEPTTGAISEERKSSVEMILGAQFNEGFNVREKEKRELTADALTNDEVVQEAHENWPDWTERPDEHLDKIKTFVETVLAKQGKVIGLGDKPPKVTYGQSADSASTNGSFNVKTGNIEISSFHPDFEQFLNTLTHENTHAFQAKLVEDLNNQVIGPNHPDYQAALALSMNREHAYISPELSAQFDSENPAKAYEQQCSEAHAFAAGNEIAQAVMQKLDKKLPEEKRQENKARTDEANFKLAKLQQEDEARRERQDLASYAADTQEMLDAKHRESELMEKQLEEGRAKADAEAEERRKQQEREEEDRRFEEEMAQLRSTFQQINPEQAKELLMEQYGMTEVQYEIFQAMAEDSPDLTPAHFMELQQRAAAAAASEDADLMAKFGMTEEEVATYKFMKKKLPSLTPEFFMEQAKSL